MSKLPYGGYTQREWERAVGWGKVPPEYEHEETQYKLNDPIWDKRWMPENKHEESDNDVQPQNDKYTRDKSDNN